MARSNERIATLEANDAHILLLLTEVRDAVTGKGGVTTRVTRLEEQQETVQKSNAKNEAGIKANADAINKLTLKVAGASGTVTIVVMLAGKVIEHWS